MSEKKVGRCWWPFRWHVWTKWKIIGVQEMRTCQRCGLTQPDPDETPLI